MENENESELVTSKTTPGQEDEYMEDEGESDESVRAGVRVLDEDSDGEEDSETTGGGTHQMGTDILKDMTALSSDCVIKESFEQSKGIMDSVTKHKEQKVIHKMSALNPPPVVPASSPERHGSKFKRFPQQYYQIRANRLRTTTEVTLGGGGHGREGWRVAPRARQWV
jgi:hypothetical protein